MWIMIYVGHMLLLIQNPWMLHLDLLLEYLIENVTFVRLYAIIRLYAWIFHRRVSGFATDCLYSVVFDATN